MSCADENEDDLTSLLSKHDLSVRAFNPTPTSSHNTSSSNITSNNDFIDITFKSRGLHIVNLNVRHLVPKLDELSFMLVNEKGPDIFGACETFLDANVSDGQIAINGFEFLRKDRCVTVHKNGGGVILYFRNILTCKRRNELEVSKLETLWAEVVLRNAKPFLLCTLYRPPNANADWIDLFEQQISIAQTTGLEIIIMGDFNIDYKNCSNKKWLSLVQLFDLSQLITSPTRETQTSSSLIDHLYSTHPENISDCFVSHYAVSDHFPICFTRKINSKVKKTTHISTLYRCFENFNEESFLSALSTDFSNFSLSHSDIDEDIVAWYDLFLKRLDQHAPLKTKRVKSRLLPE